MYAANSMTPLIFLLFFFKKALTSKWEMGDTIILLDKTAYNGDKVEGLDNPGGIRS